MPKKDHTDETPIQFHIPSSAESRHGMVPRPINQPNWIYNNDSAPRWFVRVIIGLALMFALALATLLIIEKMYTSSAWAFVLLILIGGSVSYLNGRQFSLPRANLKKAVPEKKKQPKRRKDYS